MLPIILWLCSIVSQPPEQPLSDVDTRVFDHCTRELNQWIGEHPDVDLSEVELVVSHDEGCPGLSDWLAWWWDHQRRVSFVLTRVSVGPSSSAKR